MYLSKNKSHQIGRETFAFDSFMATIPHVEVLVADQIAVRTCTPRTQHESFDWPSDQIILTTNL